MRAEDVLMAAGLSEGTADLVANAIPDACLRVAAGGEGRVTGRWVELSAAQVTSRALRCAREYEYVSEPAVAIAVQAVAADPAYPDVRDAGGGRVLYDFGYEPEI